MNVLNAKQDSSTVTITMRTARTVAEKSYTKGVSKMTVSELIKALKNYDANAKVWIGVGGKQYDVNATRPTSSCDWGRCGNDIILIKY